MNKLLICLIFGLLALLVLRNPMAATAQKKEQKSEKEQKPGKEPILDSGQLSAEQAESLRQALKEREEIASNRNDDQEAAFGKA